MRFQWTEWRILYAHHGTLSYVFLLLPLFAIIILLLELQDIYFIFSNMAKNILHVQYIQDEAEKILPFALNFQANWVHFLPHPVYARKLLITRLRYKTVKYP